MKREHKVAFLLFGHFRISPSQHLCVITQPVIAKLFPNQGSTGDVRQCSLCYRMRYVAAYLLAALGGNANPSAQDIKDILGSVGIEADDERLNKVTESPSFPNKRTICPSRH